MNPVLTYGCVLGLLAAALPADLLAQQSSSGTAGASQSALEEIVVTARRRDESLQEIPVAITAFSETELQNAGIANLEDIARFSPGMQFDNQGGQTPGRVDSVIRFRGMHVNSTAPSRQVGALFQDGIYVLGSAHSMPIDDLQRVEVIKGPQAAYFGRNTFGGAVNYITNTPSLTESSGRFSTEVSNRGDLGLSAAYEFPLLENKLSARLGVRRFENGAEYRSTDGAGLGEQQSDTIYLTLYSEPNDKLSVKFRALYGEDSDGPPVGAFIAGRQNDSCTGLTVTTPAGDVGNPQEYICGTVPSIDAAVPVMNVGNIVDSNTSLLPQIAVDAGNPNILIDRLVTPAFPDRFGSMPFIDHFGLERELFRASLSVNYQLNDALNATFQAAYADLAQVNLRDYGPTAFENSFTREGISQEDSSVELRLSYDNGGRFTWLAGLNYYQQDYIGLANFGDIVLFCVDTFSDASDPPDDGCVANLAFSHDANNDEIQTVGVFGALNYRFNDNFNVSLEGRYQEDENAQGVTRTISNTYKTFLPRVIMQYMPTETTNLYASYSEGVLPGAINQRLVDADAQETAQYLALFPGAGASTNEEKMENYELGWKQNLFDGRMRFSIAAYYAEWNDMKAGVSAAINETCRSSTSTGCRGPSFGEASVGEPATLSTGEPFMSLRGLTVAGSSELYGLEVEGEWKINDNFEAGLSYALAKSEYTDFIFIRVLRIAGFSDVAGYQLPRFPENSWAANLTYDKALGSDATFFSRVDVSYKGKTYADESNLAHCDSYTTANIRAGIQKDNARVELFAKNVTDSNDWTTCARWTDFENPLVFPGVTDRQGVAVSVANRRELGIRFSYDF